MHRTDCFCSPAPRTRLPLCSFRKVHRTLRQRFVFVKTRTCIVSLDSGVRDPPIQARYASRLRLRRARRVHRRKRTGRATAAALMRRAEASRDGARKPELRRTAWWGWQDSNVQTDDYEAYGDAWKFLDFALKTSVHPTRI
jgi:hypothetical protein